MLNSNFSGETMIFKNDKGFYSTSISKRNQDGTYANAYISVGFRKGVDLPNKTKINIKNGFLTFDQYDRADGTKATNLKLFISDFETAGGEKQPAKQNKGSEDIIFGKGQDEDSFPF